MPCVIKFGGSSLGNAKAILQVAAIVANSKSSHNCTHIVVSAMAGATNQLEKLLTEPYLPTRLSQAETIVAQHLRCVHELSQDCTSLDVEELTKAVESEGQKLLERLREVTPPTPSRVAILTTGERLSATLLTYVLQAMGMPAAKLPAAEVIAIRHATTTCDPDLALTKQRYCQLVNNSQHSVLVTEGFYGSTEDGSLGCFGRNGSDLSAAVLAIAAGARELTIWSDVDGVLSADPRLVANAQVTEQLSLAKLYSFAHLGATVVYAPTLSYLAQHQLPFCLKNTFAPEAPGTLVTVNEPRAANFFGVCAIEKIQIELQEDYCTVSGYEKSGATGRYLFAFAASECSPLLKSLVLANALESQPRLSLLSCVTDDINQQATMLAEVLRRAQRPVYQVITKPIANAVAFVVPRSSLADSMHLLHECKIPPDKLRLSDPL